MRCVAFCCVALSCVALSCVVLCLSCVLFVFWLCPGCVWTVSFEVSSGKRTNPNWCRAGLIRSVELFFRLCTDFVRVESALI